MHSEVCGPLFILGGVPVTQEMHEATQGVDVVGVAGAFLLHAGMSCMTRTLIVPAEPCPRFLLLLCRCAHNHRCGRGHRGSGGGCDGRGVPPEGGHGAQGRHGQECQHLQEPGLLPGEERCAGRQGACTAEALSQPTPAWAERCVASCVTNRLIRAWAHHNKACVVLFQKPLRTAS